MNPSAEQTWQEIEGLLDELVQFAKSDVAPVPFRAELLNRAVRALAAAGGVIWVQRDGELVPETTVLPDGLQLSSADETARRELVRRTLAAAEPRAVLPQTRLPDGAAANPTAFLALLAPLRDSSGAYGAIEIFQRPGASPAAQRGYLDFLRLLCDLTVDYHAKRRLSELEARERAWSQVDDFAAEIHARLDVRTTAYRLANEGRRLLGCDRVSVLLRRGRGYRVAAVSGVDLVDRRSNLVRSLESLSRTALATGEPLHYRGEALDLPPQLEAVLQEHLDLTHARSLDLLPLGAGEAAPLVGALLAERFDATLPDERQAFVLAALARHGGTALHNARAHQALPLVPVQRGLAALLRRVPWFVLFGLLLGSVVAGLVFSQGELRIACRGELQPRERQDVFAPADGVVDQLAVEHASDVQAGQVLLQLTTHELDYEQAKVLGELQTATKQLETTQVSLQTIKTGTADKRDQLYELSAREAELKEQLRGLREQLTVLRRQQEALHVRSPLDGQVLTWDVAESLAARPVRRGQVLLTVGRTGGEWVLELRVPDKHVGYVLAARERGVPAVSFQLATEPGTTYHGRVERVALAAESAEAESTVLVTAAFDRAQVPLRPGATVVARIACGTRSLGYVWLHDLIETARTWMFRL